MHDADTIFDCTKRHDTILLILNEYWKQGQNWK